MNEQRNLYLAIGISIAIIIFFQILIPTQPIDNNSIDDRNKIRSSTGLAASWLSPIGPLSFVFSTNLSKADTDKTESFNFNLGTTF